MRFQIRLLAALSCGSMLSAVLCLPGPAVQAATPRTHTYLQINSSADEPTGAGQIHDWRGRQVTRAAGGWASDRAKLDLEFSVADRTYDVWNFEFAAANGQRIRVGHIYRHAVWDYHKSYNGRPELSTGGCAHEEGSFEFSQLPTGSNATPAAVSFVGHCGTAPPISGRITLKSSVDAPPVPQDVATPVHLHLVPPSHPLRMGYPGRLTVVATHRGSHRPWPGLVLIPAWIQTAQPPDADTQHVSGGDSTAECTTNRRGVAHCGVYPYNTCKWSVSMAYDDDRGVNPNGDIVDAATVHTTVIHTKTWFRWLRRHRGPRAQTYRLTGKTYTPAHHWSARLQRQVRSTSGHTRWITLRTTHYTEFTNPTFTVRATGRIQRFRIYLPAEDHGKIRPGISPSVTVPSR